MHSLLKANLHSGYIKIGDPLNRIGLSRHDPRAARDSSTLSYLRKRVRPGSVVAGHIFMGLDAFLVGRFQFWMNARHPVKRLRSGLLRFYSRDSRKRSANDYDLIQPTAGLVSRDSVAEILSTSLKRECNGISRRLSAMALTDSVMIDTTTNLERLEFLEQPFPPRQLYETAEAQLENIQCLFLAEHFFESIVCLERMYDLPPLINPFTKLGHNPARVSGFTADHEQCLDACQDILMESQHVDLALWPRLNERFRLQMQSLRISKQDVEVRKLISDEALFSPRWFSDNKDNQEVIELMATSIVNRVRRQPKLAVPVLKTVCRWPGLDEQARQQLWNAAKNELPTEVS